MPQSGDRFLQAHRFKELCYQISEGISPVSIRDQMVRAQMLVDRILATDEVPDGGQVLVIGGGPAGIAAALRVAQWGQRRQVHATLLEANGLCHRLATCTSRLIAPAAYEWPAPSWSEGVFPSSSTPDVAQMSLLTWENGSGQGLADQLIGTVLGPPAGISPFLTVRRPAPAGDAVEPPRGDATSLRVLDALGIEKPQEGSPDWTAEAVEVTFESSNSERYNLVIFATGMGEDRTWTGAGADADGYWGPRFWDNDLAKEGFQGHGVPPRILISGGGDGALQDLIRLLTGQEAPDLMALIEGELQGMPAWREARMLIWQAEEEERRIRQWAGDFSAYPPPQKTLHNLASELAAERLQNTHRSATDTLWADAVVREKLLSLLQTWTAGRIPARLVLICPSIAFKGCYALNRFLALLLHRYLKDRVPDLASWLNFGNRVDSVECVGHVTPNYGEHRSIPFVESHPCWGELHHARFVKPLTYDSTRGEVPTEDEDFDIVILRHGICLPQPNHANLSSFHVSYQLLPHQPDPSYWMAYARLHLDP